MSGLKNWLVGVEKVVEMDMIGQLRVDAAIN